MSITWGGRQTNHARLADLAKRTTTLLNHHIVRLADRDQMLVAMMHAEETGDVQVVQFEKIPREATEEARPDR